MIRKILFSIFILFITINTFAQTGMPFIKNFPPYTIGMEGGQIWSIIQDSQGIMYFGGNDGVYEYDGENWRKIELKQKIAARSLGMTQNGKIFVGSVGDFGYLNPDSKGQMKYISLLNKVDSAERFFTDVWTLFADGNTVYFCSNEKIFIYNSDSPKKIKIIKDKYFYLMYKPRNEIFVSVGGEGLMKLKGDKLIPLNLPEKLYPVQVLPYGEDKYLIPSSKNGMFVYDPNAKDTKEILTKKFFDSEELLKTEKIFSESHVYTGGLALKDGTFAIGTVQKGIFIIDKKGKIINNISKEKGLLSQTVHFLFLDSDMQLWSALTYGVSYLEINSAFEQFNERDGIQGSIYDVTRFDNLLFVNSNLGIYYFDGTEFKGIKNLYEHGLQVFNPIIVKSKTGNKHFVVSTVYGMFEIKNFEASQINEISPLSIAVSETDSSEIFFTSDYDLYKFNIEKDVFSKPQKIKSFTEMPLLLTQENEKYWMIEGEKLILFDTKTNKIKTFDNSPEIKGVEFSGSEKINGKIIFYSKSGIFTHQSGKIIKYNELFGGLRENYEFVQMQKIDNTVSSVYKLNNNHYFENYDLKNLKFTDTISCKRLAEFEGFYSENQNQYWLISPNAVYKFNSKYKRKFNTDKNVLIRNIKIGRDSVIFYGNNLKISKNDTIAVYQALVNTNQAISYEYNDITFTVAFPGFEGEKGNLYSYKLIGSKDKKWSDWTNFNTKEYTNLREGEYKFQVKAKNLYGFESKISEYEFYIEPPYYRSALAYILYVILLGFLIYLIIKLNLRRLEAENKRLDNIVTERTAEISQQKEEIQTQAENLREINESLSQKNEEINQQNEEIRTIADNLQSANDEIVLINENITEKSKHITDSINYAKRIQKAILAGGERMKQIVPEHFILLMPKETVSGDFYWYNKINNHLIFAAVDCTGHGVPGAFMSMLGYAFLNEIVSKKEIVHANQVLNLLRENIINTLHQTEENTNRDGMDIALIGIDTDINILQYSGAHNPLFIVRNSGFENCEIANDANVNIYENKLLEIKADKMPISFSRNLKPFKNHSVKLQKDDFIYIFSDGYIDQTGGESKRKYMINRFRNLILSISEKSAQEQQKILTEEFFNWKGNQNKQMDDILIMGLKFDMLTE